MPSPTVTSRRHPFVQRCRQIAAGRGEPGEVLLDGPHLVEDALAAGVPIIGILTDGRDWPGTTAQSIPVHIGTPDLVDAASPVRSPTGIVAIASWAPQPIEALLAVPHTLIIGLVGVQDPGNVGNIIRSADALGASSVLALDDTAHPGGWKALRGAMGSTFRMPVGAGSSDVAVALARRRGIRIAATVVSGGTRVDEVAADGPVLVFVGSEGAGLPQPLVDAADLRVTIPMRSQVNSLNAATTAAIVIWELTRQARDART